MSIAHHHGGGGSGAMAAYASWTPAMHHFHRYAGRDGFYLEKFLIDDTVNRAQWGEPWPGIQRDAPQFAGKPMVLTPWMDHPMLGGEAPYQVGTIQDVTLQADTHSARQISELTDPAAIQAVKDGRVHYGSVGGITPRQDVYLLKLAYGQRIPETLTDTPAEFLVSDDDMRRIRESWLAGQEPTVQIAQISGSLVPYHDALVAEPAYGREKDNIADTCEGSRGTCHRHLEDARKASVRSAASSSSSLPGPRPSALELRMADAIAARLPETHCRQAALDAAARLASSGDFMDRFESLVVDSAIRLAR